MRKIEITRWWTAFGGLVLWFAYFFIQSDMTKANGRQYCADMEAAGEHCTYDYIPVFEVVFVPIVICLLAYPFARFAFSLYAPPVERRELGWRIAGVDVAESYPFPQIFAALGLLFSLSRFLALPFAFISWVTTIYWIAWMLWFSGAIFVSWPRERAMVIQLGYRGGGTVGGKLGCATAALVGLPLFGILMFANFYGHCGVGDPCRDGQWLKFLQVFVVTGLVATSAGLLARMVVNRLGGSRDK